MSNSTTTLTATLSDVWGEQDIDHSLQVGLAIIGEMMIFLFNCPAGILLPLAHLVPAKAHYPIEFIAKTYGPKLKELRTHMYKLTMLYPPAMKLLSSGVVTVVVVVIYFLSRITPLAQANHAVVPNTKWRVIMRLNAIALLIMGVVVSASLAFEEDAHFVPVRKCTLDIGLINLPLGVSFVVESVISALDGSAFWLGHGPGLTGLTLILQSLPSKGLILARSLEKNNPEAFQILAKGRLPSENKEAYWPHDRAFFEFMALVLAVHMFGHASKIVPSFYRKNRLYLSATALFVYVAYFISFLARDSSTHSVFAMGCLSMSFGPIILIGLVGLSSILLYGMGSLLVTDTDVLVGYQNPMRVFQASSDVYDAIAELFYRSLVVSARKEFMAEREVLFEARETWLGHPDFIPAAVDSSSMPLNPYARETTQAMPALADDNLYVRSQRQPSFASTLKLMSFYLRCMYRKVKAKVLRLSEEERRTQQIAEAQGILENCRKNLEMQVKLMKPRPRKMQQSVHVAMPESVDTSEEWTPGCEEYEFDDESDEDDDDESSYADSDYDYDHFSEDVVDDKVACAETIMQALEDGDGELAAAHLRSKGALTRRKFSMLQLNEASERPKLSAVLAQNRPTAPSAPASGTVCVICYCAPRDIICWPCRCLALCNDCRLTLSQAQGMLCVSCRQPVQSYSRIFRP